jgi:hypothetical protein
MKCDNCGITIPDLPEDATHDEMLCDTCYENDAQELLCPQSGRCIVILTKSKS